MRGGQPRSEGLNRAELAARRGVLVASYRQSWACMIRGWQAPRPTRSARLMYSASYLLDTGGVRWAVDPVLLDNRIAGQRR
jgi:hypothetical protein